MLNPPPAKLYQDSIPPAAALPGLQAALALALAQLVPLCKCSMPPMLNTSLLNAPRAHFLYALAAVSSSPTIPPSP